MIPRVFDPVTLMRLLLGLEDIEFLSVVRTDDVRDQLQVAAAIKGVGQHWRPLTQWQCHIRARQQVIRRIRQTVRR